MRAAPVLVHGTDRPLCSSGSPSALGGAGGALQGLLVGGLGAEAQLPSYPSLLEKGAEAHGEGLPGSHPLWRMGVTPTLPGALAWLAAGAVPASNRGASPTPPFSAAGEFMNLPRAVSHTGSCFLRFPTSSKPPSRDSPSSRSQRPQSRARAAHSPQMGSVQQVRPQRGWGWVREANSWASCPKSTSSTPEAGVLSRPLTGGRPQCSLEP